jgi:hypothetical protein
MGILGQDATRHLAQNQHTESLKELRKITDSPGRPLVSPSVRARWRSALKSWEQRVLHRGQEQEGGPG